MKRIAILTLIFLLSASQAFAQRNITVTGTVTDDQNQPLIGVGVIQKGTTNGQATDVNGKYTLILPEGATIVFSSIGFKSQEIV
ncbi:MAG: carboxypeptidase-like regulatory domain-containing protein, partial [Bacteroidales bacterium]